MCVCSVVQLMILLLIILCHYLVVVVMIETIYKHCVDRATAVKEIVRGGQSG